MGACMHLYFARTLIEQHLCELHIHVVFIIVHCTLVLYMLFCIIMYSSYWTKYRNIIIIIIFIIIIIIIVVQINFLIGLVMQKA